MRTTQDSSQPSLPAPAYSILSLWSVLHVSHRNPLTPVGEGGNSPSPSHMTTLPAEQMFPQLMYNAGQLGPPHMTVMGRLCFLQPRGQNIVPTQCTRAMLLCLSSAKCQFSSPQQTRAAQVCTVNQTVHEMDIHTKWRNVTMSSLGLIFALQSLVVPPLHPPHQQKWLN